ncbi:MAG: OPT family oligopeptide transporter [Phycisphaerae bacterium]
MPTDNRNCSQNRSDDGRGCHGSTAETGTAFAASVQAATVRKVPPLRENATPEEKELHWYQHVYRGEHVRQLTLRAVLTGGILGMFMCISNLYTTLKLGWSFGVAITACVLSYVIWNTIRAVSGNRLSEMTILENNCMQSTASAAGMSTGGTLATAVGSLLLMSGAHLPWTTLVAFTFLTAALGVFMAIPLKRQMINIEQLPFPSGMAAAETLRSLHSHGAEAVRKAYSLILALGCGALTGFFRGPEGVITTLDKIYRYVHIPELVPFGGLANPMSWLRQSAAKASLAGLGFEPGTLMIAAGAFVGTRVSFSMLAGSILLYYVAMPLFVSHGAQVAVAGTSGYVSADSLSPGAILLPTRWALWGGTSIMVFSSLVSVGIQWRTLARSFRVFRRASCTDSQPTTRNPHGSSLDLQKAMDAIEVPSSWLIGGLIPIGIAIIFLNYFAFHMSIWLGAIAVAMSFVLSLVACRATGETDTTPTGAMGKVTQLVYAILAKGNYVVNLMSAGTTAAAAGSAADLLTDLKSGYLLGANPRRQFLAQFFGIFFGVAAIIPAWYLMVPTAERLHSFNPPAVYMWKAMADALTQGLHTIPITAQWAILIGAVLGIILPVLAAKLPKAAPYLPSAMGLGLAWVVPFQNSLSFAIGAVIAWVWARMHKKSAETYTFPVAAGLIAGESIVLAFIAIAATATQLFGHQ